MENYTLNGATIQYELTGGGYGDQTYFVDVSVDGFGEIYRGDIHVSDMLIAEDVPVYLMVKVLDDPSIGEKHDIIFGPIGMDNISYMKDMYNMD